MKTLDEVTFVRGIFVDLQKAFHIAGHNIYQINIK